jgi:hydrogenase maturation protease
LSLVIGYGSELRGDDAVGQLVARAVAGWGLPEVRALAVHQLTPELAPELAAARLALFVDAGETAGGGWEARPIAAKSLPITSAHSGDPRALLALTHALYGHAPRAWLVTIAAARFDVGAGLSPETAEAATAALEWIRSHLGGASHARDRADAAGA